MLVKRTLLFFLNILYLPSVAQAQDQSNWWNEGLKPEMNVTSIPIENPFPLAGFLEATGIPGDLRWRGLQCQRRINVKADCECDQDCQVKGTCCIDYLWHHNTNNTENATALESAKMYQHMLDSSIKDFSCLPILPLSSTIKQHFIMVAGCSESASKMNKQKCIYSESNERSKQIPVRGDDQYLYKNEYCARCNGVLDFKVETIELVCDESHTNPWDFQTKTVFELLEKGCSIEPSQGYKYNIVKCQPDTCPTLYASYCRVFAARFHPRPEIKSESSKNVYCFKCNGGLVNPEAEVDPTFEMFVHSGGWSKTVDINELLEGNTAENVCPLGELKSSYGECVQMQCGFGFDLVKDQCVKILSRKTVSDNQIRILPIFNETTTTVEKCLPQVHPNLALFIFFDYDVIKHLSVENITKTIFEKYDIKGEIKFLLQADGDIVIQSPELKQSIPLAALQQDVFTNNVGILKIVLASSIYNLPLVHTLELSQFFEGSRLCALVNELSIPDSETTCESLGMDKTLLLELHSNSSVKRKIFKCDSFYLDSNCLRQDIRYESYSLDKVSKLLTIQTEGETNVTYSAAEYAPNLVTGRFQICIANDTESSNRHKYRWQENVQIASYIISLIGTIISIISHFIFIGLFYLVGPLRNTGGLYVAVLVIFLLVSDLLFVTSINLTENTGACKWFGILLYFALLNVCCWTVVVALDMTLKFSSSFGTGSSDPQKTLTKRISIVLVLCTTTSLLIVILNETKALEFSFEKSCWIGDHMLRICFYVIPILLTYIACIVDLGIILYGIRKGRQNSQVALGNSISSAREINLLHIAIKLMVILGISEAFGLIRIQDSMFSENEAIFNAIFGLFYDLTRSLRGVLIFVVYMFNDKTFDLIKSELIKRRKRELPYGVSYSKEMTHSTTTSGIHI